MITLPEPWIKLHLEQINPGLQLHKANNFSISLSQFGLGFLLLATLISSLLDVRPLKGLHMGYNVTSFLFSDNKTEGTGKESVSLREGYCNSPSARWGHQSPLTRVTFTANLLCHRNWVTWVNNLTTSRVCIINAIFFSSGLCPPEVQNVIILGNRVVADVIT